MAGAQLPKEKIDKILALRKQGQPFTDIAAEVGCDRTVAARYCKQFKVVPELEEPSDDPIDLPIDERVGEGGETRIVTRDRPLTLEQMTELFKIDRKVWIPTNLRTNAWNGFYKVKLGNLTKHQKVTNWQTRVTWKRVVSENVEAAILQFVREHVGPVKVKRAERRENTQGYAVSWGIWDAHLGMYAWNSEVNENFDLSIARNRVLNSIDDMVTELKQYPIEKIWMPIGNDFMHFDSVKQKTTFGEHHLDGDGRYGKVYLAALECLSYMVERALELTDNLELIYVPGNHDLTSSYTLCVALQERYREDPRVKVDLSFNPRKYRRHGGTLLGFDHGQDVSPAQLAQIMASENQHQWQGVTYREVQVGHKHQRREVQTLIPTNGLMVRTNPALCNVDAWHHKSGLIGEPVKSVEAWRYDRTGFRGSHVAWARDEQFKCPNHPTYQAKRAPTSNCAGCLAMWNARQS